MKLLTREFLHQAFTKQGDYKKGAETVHIQVSEHNNNNVIYHS